MTDGKVCTKCGQWKPLTEYYKQKTGAGGRRADCKGCVCKFVREYNAAHLEERREYNAANREHKQEYKRKYDAAHPEKLRGYQQKYRAANQEKMREYRRKYGAAHPDKIRANKHRREARKRLLPDHWTTTHMQIALDHFGGMCAVCGRPPGLWHTIAWDHWIPLTADNCPGTVPWNMVPLCHGENGCNNSKHNRNALEWLTDRYGPRRARALWKQITGWLESQRVDG